MRVKASSGSSSDREPAPRYVVERGYNPDPARCAAALLVLLTHRRRRTGTELSSRSTAGLRTSPR